MAAKERCAGSQQCPFYNPQGSLAMSEHVYKKIELVGSSPKSIEDAIRNAVETAGSSVRNMRWFEVVETRGHIEDGKIAHYQVTIKVGFTVEASK
ncbi:MAG: dodecin [Planctomycetaceae bacterium]